MLLCVKEACDWQTYVISIILSCFLSFLSLSLSLFRLFLINSYTIEVQGNEEREGKKRRQRSENIYHQIIITPSPL